MGRVGWRWKPEPGFQLEAGLKLFLPISPIQSPHFRYYEWGGFIANDGTPYGGTQLGRQITAYLEGSI